jgi:hypothetical protein
LTDEEFDRASLNRWATVGIMRSIAELRFDGDPAAAVALKMGASELERADIELAIHRQTPDEDQGRILLVLRAVSNPAFFCSCGR